MNELDQLPSGKVVSERLSIYADKHGRPMRGTISFRVLAKCLAIGFIAALALDEAVTRVESHPQVEAISSISTARSPISVATMIETVPTVSDTAAMALPPSVDSGDSSKSAGDPRLPTPERRQNEEIAVDRSLTGTDPIERTRQALNVLEDQ